MANHRSDFLPEEFLWHAFYQLARAIYVLGIGPFTRLDDPARDEPTGEVLHLDMKPANSEYLSIEFLRSHLTDVSVMLGPPKACATFKTYPTFKLADFGLSMLTTTGTYDHVPNPSELYWRFTPDQAAPEQLYNYTLGWHHPLSGEYDRHGTLVHRRYSSKLNVFTLGLQMFRLIFFKYFSYYQRQVREMTEQQSYHHMRQHCLNVTEDSTLGHVFRLFSKSNCRRGRRLITLLMDCLHPDPRMRPTVSHLLRETRERLRDIHDEMQRQGRAERPVYPALNSAPPHYWDCLPMEYGYTRPAKILRAQKCQHGSQYANVQTIRRIEDPNQRLDALREYAAHCSQREDRLR